MNYKRLRSRIKGSQQKSFEQVENAFEVEGQVLQPHFTPIINHPDTDYSDKIDSIKQIDSKLGITFERLNQHQRHAVFHSSKNTILSAMVGSGKTTVIIAKIFYLHFIKSIPFSQMVVLTFTNKAAREIKERIIAFLGDKTPHLNEELRYFGTFHAIARQLLQEHPQLESIGFEPDFMIMDEQEKQAFLERLIIQENFTIKYQKQLAKRWRKYHKSGETLMGNMKTEDNFVPLVRLAELEKRRINTMDFDDLISLCNALMANQGMHTPSWVIVDEFQDCNEEQLQLIEHLRRENTQLFVVGDQNQSIYGWRGSKEELFQEIQQEWNATWMELPQNYRSTGSILSAAENLLQDNKSSLIATRQSGEAMELVRHFDDLQEAYYLREQMGKLQKANIPLENIAILFRTHQQIGIVETVFAQSTVPHQLVKRSALHEDPAQSFLLRILKLCVNPNDIDACIAIVCDKTFGIIKANKSLIQKIHTKLIDRTALQAMKQYLEQSKDDSKDYIHLLTQIEVFDQAFLKGSSPNGDALLDFLALHGILKPTSIHHKTYLSAIHEAWKQVRFYLNKKDWGEQSSMFHVAIDQVVLEGTFQINDRIKEQGHGVHLLTIHASKGLEFDRVYIAGANTGIIPLAQHQKGSGNLKEEKRLLFVAMTRAKNQLEIGWHAQPTLRNAEPEPSYFLNAIPETLLKRRRSDTSSKQENQTSPEKEEWEIDQYITHKKYGIGKITKVDEKELVCLFDTVGEKSFSTAFAKVLLIKEEARK